MTPPRKPIQPPLPDDSGSIDEISLEDEVQQSFLEYAMSVIVSRALPDARDGLKPVHRRILFAALEAGLRPDRPFRKCAALVGDVMKKYHPHGDQAIYDAMARLAQDFSTRYLLIDGQGNFGSIDGDAPAAMRYCNPADTLIRTPTSTLRLGELAHVQPNSEADIDVKVVGRNGNPVRATRLFHSGDHKILRLRTREGYEVEGTHNHPLLCLVPVAGVPMFQWKPLEEMRVGDRVAMFRQAPDGDGSLTEDEYLLAELTGAWISEGWASEKHVGFGNLDQEWFAEVTSAYDRLIGGARRIRAETLKSGKILHRLDAPTQGAFKSGPLAEIIGQKSLVKRIPDLVWARNAAFKRAFLQAMFEGDGTSALLGRNTIQIAYCTYSQQLAREIQAMMLEFGVVSRLSRGARGEIKVYIGNRRDARLFASRIGFWGRKQEKLLAELATIPEVSRAMSSDHVPYVAEYIRQETMSLPFKQREWLIKHNIDRIERWERDGEKIMDLLPNEVARVVEPLVSGDYYFAEVAEIEDAGVQPVYSIRVDSDDHAFISNGFVSHNTEARLSKLAMELVREIDEETVDFIPNYDGYEVEPIVLPARFPNLLVNGSSGIAVGMATNIPPHNLNEVVAAIVEIIDTEELQTDRDKMLKAAMKHVKGPDFPTGALIVGQQGIKDAYTTGRGSVKMRAVCEIEEGPKGAPRIIVTELPYQVNKARLLIKIADLVNAKENRLEGIADLRDESSDRGGMRIVIDLKKSAVPQVVLNTLYKRTQLQDNFGVYMLALIDGVPRTLNLAEAINAYLEHQVDVIGRRTKFRLKKAEDRLHIVEGLIVALDHIDDIVALIREASDVETARNELMSRYSLSEVQAQHILDMPLKRLTGLEQGKIREEYEELKKTIKELKAILKDPKRILEIIKAELLEIKDRFGDDRRSRIVPDEGEFDIEDLIADEDLVVTVSRDGYIKSVPLDTYRRQGRGGRGVRGAKLKEGDIVEHMIKTTAHAYLLLFSNSGRVYRLKAHEIPKRDRTARGTAAVNVVAMRPEDSVAAVIDTRDYESYRYLLIATKRGMVKKTLFREYDSSRKEGIIALNLKEGDEVVKVSPTSGKDHVLLITKKGKAIRFKEDEVRPMGRTATGVIGIRLRDDDEVVACDVIEDTDAELLVVTEGGYGKRTKLGQFPIKKRAGMGVIAAKLTKVRGDVIGAACVRQGDEIFLISDNGVVIRMNVDTISRQGRPTTGVRVMNLPEGAKVSAVAPTMGEAEIDVQGQLET